MTSSSLKRREISPTVILIIFLYFIKNVISEDAKFIPLTREFVKFLEDSESYNRYAIPTYMEGKATNVTLSMYIEGISSFSAQSMDFALDVYFQQLWYDKRLAHNGSAPILIKDRKILGLMWHPDLYFANARHASFQEITDDNFLVWLYPDGKIWYDCRISMVVICAMDLRKYPLDSQTCELRILSYAYPESQLKLAWSTDIDPAIDQNPDIRMPDMHLRKIESGWCNGTYATGVWSCQTAVFKVDRQMTQHIMQTYLPSGIIIVISWFNFWLDIDSAPARVSLSITVLLTISTQANGVKLALPEVSYLKAIDVWLGVCLAFAFGVMIEFTICHYAKNQEMRHTAPTSNLILDQTLSTLFGSSSNGEAGKGSYPFIDEDDAERQLQRENSVEARLRIPPELNAEAAIKFMMNGGDPINQARLKNKQRSLRVNAKQALSWTRNLCNIRGRAVAIKIDERSRIAFPLTFLLFNFVYWTFYLYSS